MTSPSLPAMDSASVSHPAAERKTPRKARNRGFSLVCSRLTVGHDPAMAQITEDLALDALKRCEQGQHPPLTAWETQQLIYAWLERERMRIDGQPYLVMALLPDPPSNTTLPYRALAGLALFALGFARRRSVGRAG